MYPSALRVRLAVIALGLVLAGWAPAQNIADQVVEYINQARVANGEAPLTVSSELSDAAVGHARNMAAQYVCTHYLDGAGPGERITAAGYQWTCWRENTAWNWGHADPAWAVAQFWLNSNKHRTNILAGDVTEIGVAWWTAEDGTIFYCAKFANR
jgi:uncharacterized protein YkwD